MDKIIGLGSAGCKIADEFSKYPQYEIYKIDTDITGKNCFSLTKQPTPEEYEKNCPNMKEFFKDIDGDILFIIGGGGKISGASLKILQQLQNCNINVLFIVPNKEDLSANSILQNKLVFNVLQEYARSGVLQKIYLISNKNIEEIIGDVPILQHSKKINETIVSSIHYLNIFNNTEPVIENADAPSEIARIATFGILSAEEEKYFFNIQQQKNKIYFYGIPESILNSDSKLLKNIREVISSNDVRAGYKIYSTKHTEKFCYFMSFSNVIQPLDN